MKDNIFSPAFIEELKAKNDIVNVVGKYVRLEKKGKNFWGCCPFHHEKTPSFAINEYEQFYHCFGCGESGDVITFLRKYENLEYIDAIKILAENAGMELPKLENNEKFVEQKKLKDKCLKILNLAKEFYKQSLLKPNAKIAQEYIKKRNLGRHDLEDFELGYSPNYYDIVNFLKKEKFTDEELKASGVCEISKSGKPYDFLSERLIFPIINTQGDCIGFSGRDLTNSAMAKYKNTSATLAFNKSKAIFGINLLKKHKQEKGLNTAILVEGQFDVITMHHNGFENAVACLGTAVTKDHIKELKRFCNNVIICLDGDSAGQKAILRTLEVFKDENDLNVKCAVLPNGQDPDEFLKANKPEKMQELLDNALTPTAFKIHVLKCKYDLTKLDEKTKFVKEALAEISKLASVSEQEIYLAEINKLTKISVDFLRRDLNPNLASSPPPKPENNFTQPELDGTVKAVKFVLASLVFKKDYANWKINLSDYITNPTLKNLFQFLWDKHKKNEEIKVSQLYDEFDVENDAMLQNVINFNFAEVSTNEDYFNNCIWQMIENELKFRKSELSKQYKEEFDTTKKTNILAEIVEIDKQLKRKNLGDFINE